MNVCQTFIIKIHTWIYSMFEEPQCGVIVDPWIFWVYDWYLVFRSIIICTIHHYNMEIQLYEATEIFTLITIHMAEWSGPYIDQPTATCAFTKHKVKGQSHVTRICAIIFAFANTKILLPKGILCCTRRLFMK